VDNSSLEQWRKRLAAIFTAEIQATGVYDQLRYIDVSGNEIVRVNATTNGSPYVVPLEELQNKSDRDYFIESQELNVNQFYVSRAGLNREGSPPTLEIPYEPVIRYIIPIVDKETGERAGVLVANVFINQLIDQLDLTEDIPGNLYITDNEGYFIHNPNSDREWGAPQDLDTGFSIETEFPEFVPALRSAEQQASQIGENVISRVEIYPDPSDIERVWNIFIAVPTAALYQPIDEIVVGSGLFAIVAFLTAFIVFVVTIRLLFRPLKRLGEGAEQLGEGNFDIQLPVESDDDIGRLATIFNKTAARLKELYESLEEKVADKTKVLNEKLSELQETQKAMSNVLEDIEVERKKMTTILESIGDGVFVVDKGMHIILINRVAAQLAGVSVEHSLGKPFYEVLRFESESGAQDPVYFVKDVFEKGDIQEMRNHTVIVNKDGKKIPVADSAAPVYSSEGKIEGAVVVFRDVTTERAIDKAKTEFVSLASHQLRTPLTAIGWYVEMLQKGEAGPLTEQQEDFLREIALGNKRMVDLVNALLNTSRIDMGTFAVDPQPTDIVAVAKSVVSEMEHEATGRGVSVVEQYDFTIGARNFDPKLIRIVFQNILSNAVKYTPEGGSVRLQVETTGEKLLITVSDTGYGIPKDQQEKIFEKLFRADNVRERDTEGTGLGLYIVKSIVEESGGRIWFESAENKGTTFYVELPLSGMKARKGTRDLS
jgi:PAS domain S-box-containing protein